MQSIAVIYDNTLRPETTGIYCRRALAQLALAGEIQEVEHFLPTELERIPENRFNLFLFVDDGLPTTIPDHLRPAVWWAIDTHLGFERCLQIAQNADLTFAAQKDGAERLREHGIASATWLPLACDPEIHGRQHRDKLYDLCFVGNRLPGIRQDLLEVLSQHYPSMFIGQRYLEQMAELYSSSRIIFNRSILNDVNMRVFEGLCSGSLLLTNDLTDNGQHELFQSGVHLATYSNTDDLLDKLRYYLTHDDEREQIAAAGRQEVLAKHTYRHRMETILKAVSAYRERGQDGSESIRSAVTSKERAYFEFDRPDVLELVPLDARRILDLGCGGGRLGAAIKSRQEAEVIGIELNPIAARQARQILDGVHIANIETDTLDFSEGRFDCVICADVLEHLRQPELVLKKLKRWLVPGGNLITSIPNVRNRTVVKSLLAGNWTYESAGLLDADHVRFFTRRELEKLLYRAGFTVQQMRMVPDEGFSDWVESGRPLQVSLDGLQIKAATADEAAEFFAYQYLTRSSSNTTPTRHITSIIIPVFNQLQYTRTCIDSIRLSTDEPYELIIVDNASTDGTTEYLQSLDGVKVIFNDTNRGFPAACNQGLNASSGGDCLLLNNDTIVTTGWLRRLLDVLHSRDDIGLVGPVSNCVSGDQQVEVSYTQLCELDGFAWDWAMAHQQHVIETDRLVGFCLMLKRAALDAIGLLDERFGIGNFEDDDYCRRAHAAGFKSVIARGAFIHHFGSATFRGSGVDFNALLATNSRLFKEKWNAKSDLQNEDDIRVEVTNRGRPRPNYLISTPEGSGLKLVQNEIKLSACLIVRDNENTIRPCLESLIPWVDEVVVVDTGSQDRTPAICEELGVRLFQWAWQDDFAAARNVSLDRARGEWIFWMDSDDTLPAECGRKLRELINGTHPDEVLGYIMQVHCPGDSISEGDSNNSESRDCTVVDHVKLIRNRSDLRFDFRIHEQILPAIRRAGGEVAWTDLYVVHSGSDRTPDGKVRKLERDFRILGRELEDHPNHPFVLFNLGMSHADAGNYYAAISHLHRCVHVSQSQESHLRKAYALLVSSQSQVRLYEDAWESCRQGLSLYPNDKELLFREAMLHHQFGRLAEAAHSYLRVLEEPIEQHFSSLDVGLMGYKARHNLAIVYEDQEKFELAESQWRSITRERPEYQPAWQGLANSLLRQNKPAGDALQEAAKLRAM